MYLDIRDFEKLKRAIVAVVEEYDGIDLPEIVEDIEESELVVKLLNTPSQTTVVVGASGMAEAISHVLYELCHLDKRVFRFRGIYFLGRDTERESGVEA